MGETETGRLSSPRRRPPRGPHPPTALGSRSCSRKGRGHVAGVVAGGRSSQLTVTARCFFSFYRPSHVPVTHTRAHTNTRGHAHDMSSHVCLRSACQTVCTFDMSLADTRAHLRHTHTRPRARSRELTCVRDNVCAHTLQLHTHVLVDTHLHPGVCSPCMGSCTPTGSPVRANTPALTPALPAAHASRALTHLRPHTVLTPARPPAEQGTQRRPLSAGTLPAPGWDHDSGRSSDRSGTCREGRGARAGAQTPQAVARLRRAAGPGRCPQTHPEEQLVE